ncbi:PASTA domain-containing protein, partial [bacterium]|nr:PASTA domain-containing protein [bacterium]
LYPEGDLAAHLIGYTGTGNIGRAGLEFSLNEKMKGTPHKILTKYTIKGRSRKPLADVDYTKIITRGADVVLTIDSYMQFVVERELAKVRKQFKAIYANAVVLHPKSGEILAMANSPSFDPNHYSDYAGELRKNRLLVDVYEPGSVIKPFTVIAALDQRVVTPEMKFYCEKGRFYFHGRTIRDDIHRFEDLSVHDILVRSSNIGTVKIAQRLAPNDWRRQSALLYDYLRRFGFKHRGEKTLPVLPGETGGILRHPREWMPASIGAVPYGQEIATNSVTLAAAYAAIANRGVYQPPQIIKGYKTEDRLFYPRQPRDSYRIVRRDVVEEVVEMMVDVTEDPEGTGTNVRIPGYSVAGKTGTAQIPDPVHGGYKRGSRIASFAGFFPARDPQAVIIVMVEEPQNGKYGGEVAGPAWKAIAEELVAYWGISPTVPDDPLFVKAQEEHGRSKVEQMKAEMDRERTFGVTKMLRVPEDRDPNADLTTMPNLIGLPIRQAYIALAKRGLTATFAGSGKIASQPIPAGTPIEQKGHIGKVECTAMLTDPNVADPSNTLVTLN